MIVRGAASRFTTVESAGLIITESMGDALHHGGMEVAAPVSGAVAGCVEAQAVIPITARVNHGLTAAARDMGRKRVKPKMNFVRVILFNRWQRLHVFERAGLEIQHREINLIPD